jgi:hypothetical protein
MISMCQRRGRVLTWCQRRRLAKIRINHRRGRPTDRGLEAKDDRGGTTADDGPYVLTTGSCAYLALMLRW